MKHSKHSAIAAMFAAALISGGCNRNENTTTNSPDPSMNAGSQSSGSTPDGGDDNPLEDAGSDSMDADDPATGGGPGSGTGTGTGGTGTGPGGTGPGGTGTGPGGTGTGGTGTGTGGTGGTTGGGTPPSGG